MTRRSAFVAITDDSDDEDIDKITSYCERCKSFGFYHKLGPRIYPNDEPKPYDSDKWLQCKNCGTIVPRVHAQQENEIAPIVDPPETIHDSNNVTVLSANSGQAHRRSRAIIKQIQESRPGYRRRKMIEEDQDVQAMLAKGKQLVSYSDSSADS